MPLHRFLAWCDDGFESKLGLSCWVLSDGEPEKVESCFAFVLPECMPDACFTGFQFQTHTPELLRNYFLTFFGYPLKAGQMGVGHVR